MVVAKSRWYKKNEFRWKHFWALVPANLVVVAALPAMVTLQLAAVTGSSKIRGRLQLLPQRL